MWYSAVGWIVTLTLSFLAAPLVEADAQPSTKVATIGYLSIAGGAPGGVPLAEAFREGLQELGYVEGKTIAIEYVPGRENLSGCLLLLPSWSSLRWTL
jgi:hypothetical protein